MRAITADIGGTHARFAVATRSDDGRISLGQVAKLKVADCGSLQDAFEAFRAGAGPGLPNRAMFALAAPTNVERITLANNPWIIRPAEAAGLLELDEVNFINDFAAVAHAISACPADQFRPLAGPAGPLPKNGAISVIGPGTGLGVAMLLTGAAVRVVATEGGHIDYAPLDAVEDAILAQMRARFGRVSAERLVAGPGLAQIYGALAVLDGRAIPELEDAALWAAALEEKEPFAVAALERWCMALGSVTGDLALAHGAEAVVLAGGMLPRVQHLLGRTGFYARFLAKGRFQKHMSAIPILQITHPEPGLLGAAAALFSKDLP
jgi:glucokinase